MPINLLKDRGVPLSKQRFNWKDLVQKPISKLDDDAFTRVRTILMNGVELAQQLAASARTRPACSVWAFPSRRDRSERSAMNAMHFG